MVGDVRARCTTRCGADASAAVRVGSKPRGGAFEPTSSLTSIETRKSGSGKFPMTPGHRADIDGLRALAVLSVLLHHYLVPGFRGGFVGVDVFFVISGFLIAAHIKSDIAAGRFSLLAFYERRIRRILPALFLVFALFLVLAFKVYFPPDLHFQTLLAA